MGKAWAVKLPLSRGDDNIGYDVITNFKDMAKQNLKMLLLTVPGERIMDEYFGVGMRNFLFEPNTSATVGNVISKIQEQVGIYLPYLSIEDIQVSHADYYISVSIQYRIIPIGIYDALETVLTHGE